MSNDDYTKHMFTPGIRKAGTGKPARSKIPIDTIRSLLLKFRDPALSSFKALTREAARRNGIKVNTLTTRKRFKIDRWNGVIRFPDPTVGGEVCGYCIDRKIFPIRVEDYWFTVIDVKGKYIIDLHKRYGIEFESIFPNVSPYITIKNGKIRCGKKEVRI